MSDFQQLTEKYRPKKFGEVKGQPAAVSVLENMILNDKISPTIMLSGPYGTGKTTLGRMIARYLNCKTRNACGTCSSCLSMDHGTHPDLLEINAANSRGIDDIRELITKSTFNPRNNYRVIILDECHQLTPQAAQALLVPLEQPSKKTIWVLCTTDAQKILPAIRSRAQQVKLVPLRTTPVVKLLQTIAASEKFAISDDALEVIAEMSQGHARDAVKLLEQLQRYAENNTLPDNVAEILPEVVAEMAEIPPAVLVSKYAAALLAGDNMAIAFARKSTKPEYFVASAFKQLKNFLFFLKGLESAAGIESFASSIDYKYNFTEKHIVDILDLHLEASDKVRGYTSDSQDVVDLLTLKSLEIIKTAPRKA